MGHCPLSGRDAGWYAGRSRASRLGECTSDLPPEKRHLARTYVETNRAAFEARRELQQALPAVGAT
jgi:hypothetical protein